MLPDRLILLLTRQLTGTLTPEESTELQHLLQQQDNEHDYGLLKKFWKLKQTEQAPDVENALAQVLHTISAEAPTPALPYRKKKNRWWVAAGVAATVVIAVAITFSKLHTDLPVAAAAPEKTEGGDVVEKQNSKGTRSIITLADGSKVWLNADSRLLYPPTFQGNTREVSLSGEAFFDVAKDKTKPFIIHLKQGTVRVLGTSFNIKAYEADGAIETSVATGRVAFIPAQTGTSSHSDTTFLTKNLKAVYDIQSGKVKTAATVSAVDKAWTDGKLIFNATGMDEIATTLERYFAKQVVINDDELRSYHLTGSFENNSIEEILYYLSKTKPFTYRITETQIILSAVR